MDSEVLVVGAGPTGLTAAIELIRRGVDTRLVDRARHRSPHAKAVVLWPRALEAMARLGAEERIRDLAVPITAGNYHAHGRRVARINYRHLAGSRFDTPLSLPQNLTEEVLHGLLKELGGQVEYGHTLESLEQSDGEVLAGLSGLPHRARWVLGCDGAHSTVRSAAGVPFSGSTYAQSFVLVDGDWDTPLPHSESHYFMGRTGVLVVVGLPGGQSRVFASVPEETAEEQVVELVSRLAEERCPVPLRLQEATGSGLFRVHRRVADRFRSGRVLLAGDAAHVHSPAGGQGLNTSIQDSHELAWRLSGVLRGTLDPAQLDAWERERLHVARAVVADTDSQTRLWTLGGWRSHARDLLAKAAEVTGVLDRSLPLRQAQFTLAYPADGPEPGRPAPGTRLPDLPLCSGAPPQTGIRLHDLLRAGRHLLLVRPGARSPHGFPGQDWIDSHRAAPVRTASVAGPNNGADGTGPVGGSGRVDGTGPESVDPSAGPLLLLLGPDDSEGPSGLEHVARTLGLRRPGAVLVRPDGVVAAAGPLSDPDLLRRIDSALPDLDAPFSAGSPDPVRSHVAPA